MDPKARRHALDRIAVRTSASTVTAELSRIFDKIYATRRRIWMLTLARAAAGASWLWLLSLLLLGSFSLLFPFPPPIRIALLVLHVAAIGLGAWLGLRYAFTDKVFTRGRRLRAWALHCEEMFPALGNRLVTCVDLAEQPDGHPLFESNPVAKALLRDTTARFRPFDPVRAVPPFHFGFAVAMGIVPVLLFGLLFLTSGSWIGRVVPGLYAYGTTVVNSASTSIASQIDGITVQPGTVEVPRGSSVTIEAQVNAIQPVKLDEPPIAHVAARTDQDHGPGAHVMLPKQDADGAYFFAMHEVAQQTDYQVSLTVREPKEANTSRLPAWLSSWFAKASGPAHHDWQSSIYTITPYDPPEVESIRSTLAYPDYTGLPDETVEGPYIKGLTGSSATIRVRSNRPLREAHLAGDSDTPLPARISGGEDGAASQVAEFQLELDQDRSLRLELVDKAGHRNLNPPLIVVRTRPDAAPAIRVERPGADWSVHPVAEIDISVEAEDDYGLCDLSWEYRINGGAPVTELLFAATSGEPAVRSYTMTKTVALEDLNLKVGDSIYYRFAAGDARAGRDSADAEVTEGMGYSQPYFLAIRPFDGTFFKGGPVAGGGGVPDPSERQVIVATMRFADERGRMDEAKQRERSGDISRTQREVRLNTERLRGRLQGATDVPDLPERLNHLDQAIAAMSDAERLLDQVEPGEALPHENAALNHQMAALAGLPQFANWMQDGAPSPYPPDAETDLAGQRVDFDKDKYELFEAPKADALDKALVEALEKVRALAQRQKEFLETIRREREEQGSGSGPGSANSPSESPGQTVPPGQRFEDMLQQAKESRRELERLRDAMDEIDNLDDETLNNLREALDRTARELAKLDEALGKKDFDRAEGANQRAVQELNDLQLALEDARGANAEEQLRRLAAQIERWIEAQRALHQATGELKQVTSSQSNQRSSLSEQQQRLGDQTAQAAQAMMPGGGAGGGSTSPEPLREGLEEAAQWMQQAAEIIEAGRDADARQSQEAIVRRLVALRDAANAYIENMGGQDSMLAEALETVQTIQDALTLQESVDYKDRTYVPGVQSGPLITEPPAGDGGTPQDLYNPNAVAPDIYRNPPHVIGAGLAQLEQLVADDPQLRQAVEKLRGFLQGLPSGGTGSFGDPGMIQTYREIRAALEDFEELLLERLEISGQEQRLQQTAPDDLPAKYRDMAAKYFEALSNGPQTSNTSGDTQRP